MFGFKKYKERGQAERRRVETRNIRKKKEKRKGGEWNEIEREK